MPTKVQNVRMRIENAVLDLVHSHRPMLINAYVNLRIFHLTKLFSKVARLLIETKARLP